MSAALAAEAKGLQEKLADHERTDASVKTTLTSRKRKRATVAVKQMVAPRVEFAFAKVAHALLVDVSPWSETDVTKTQVDLESCKAQLGKVGKASKLASSNLGDAQKPSIYSANAAEVVLRQLTKMFSHVLLFEGEVSSLEVMMSQRIGAGDDTTSSPNEQSRQSRMLKARIDLLKDTLKSPKQEEATSCDMEVVRRKVADAKSDMKNLAGGLCQDVFGSYASF